MKQFLQDDKADPLSTNSNRKRSRLRKTILLSFLLGALTTSTFAQNNGPDSTGRYRAEHLRTWSVGAFAGLLTPHTLFWSNKNNDYRTPTETFGYGIFVKKQIIPAFGFQVDWMRGEVKGIRAQTPLGITQNSSYTTKFGYAANLTAHYTFVNFKMHDEFGLIGPYIKSGIGYSNFKPEAVNSGNTEPGYREAFIIPAGLGLKIGLWKGVNLDMGYTINFMKTDRFDSYDYGNTYDKWSFSHIGLEIALGKKSKHQMSWYNPSARVGNPYDDTALKRAIARLDSLQKEDRARYDRELGDADNDGVANKFDKCPNTPDSVRVDGSGCPLPKFAADILRDAFNNLEFEFGKANIRNSSYPSLDKLAQLLVDHGYTLKISGHTDAIGSDKFNFKLSKDRAEAVKSYLVRKGANASKIEATGYGEYQPIAPNDTPEGRAKNRRVELTLY
ncbi:DUF6089 family protein [Desertivirga brevis]|uniref:DUF6089 family protein n=1 Tax=Desertivirga brevis TaxID=2810310 RepID=UPI001A970362|nr:DUF6089 family protein [Pedobacter sp. SYSU D00873]